MNTYLKIKDTLHPATFRGRRQDNEWNGRDSIAVTLEMTYEEATAVFVDELQWSLVQQYDAYADRDGNLLYPDLVETDYSDYCVAGSITDNRNGTVSVKMGKLMDAEALTIILGG